MGLEGQGSKIDTTVAFPQVNTEALANVVRQALRRPTFQILQWGCRSLTTQISNPATEGLYRFTGIGQDGAHAAELPDASVSWSLILKIVRLTEQAPEGWGDDLFHFGYWKREALAYQSGLLNGLVGDLTAPRCFDTTEQPNGGVWLWLEEIIENAGAPWPLTRYGLAARHFGQWQGAYLAGQPLPIYPWLHTGWLRSWIDHFEFVMDFLLRPGIWQNPLVHRAFPVPITDRVQRLWAQRMVWLDILDRLPQTLCHFDIWHPNLFARTSVHGREQTVAIDWQSVGLGPAGETGNLMLTSLMNLEVRADDAKILDAAIWESYLEGLREAGWRGDPRAVRFCYTAYPALRWGWVFPMLMILPCVFNESKRAEAEAKYQRPIEELLEQWASVFYFLLDLAEEARCLGTTL